MLPEFFVFPGSAWLKTMGIVGVSFLGMVVTAFMKFDGEPMQDIGKSVRGVDWNLLLLVAVAIPMSDIMRSAESGIMPTVMQFVTPIVNNLGITTFTIGVAAIMLLLTQVTHNVVLGAMFMPVFCPMCEQLGGSGLVCWFLLYFALSSAYMTPAGSMNAAMIFGHELTSNKYSYMLGIAMTVVVAIVMIAMYPVLSAILV